MLALLLVLGYIVCVIAEAGWDEPDICNGGQGWKKVPNPYKYHHAPKPYDNKWQSDDASVVVLIAALRESRCPQTLVDMYSKARNPNRIFFGIVQQNEPLDLDCQVGACAKLGTPAVKQADGSYVAGDCKLFNQVRMLRMKASEARGPVFARGHQQTLVEPEDDFCMQIDAHTDVIQDWDRKILDQWGSVDNEYAILTSYPTNVHDLGHNSNRHWEMPILCMSHIIGPGLIRNHQASACANLRKPVLAPLWAAGLSFGNCHHERNVANDKMLKGVFMGEEYARGARLWTAGYDFYAPSRPVVGTYYGGEKGGKGHFGADPGDGERSKRRLTTLLNWPGSDQSPKAHADLGEFDLGKRRTLDQYAQFSGMDTQKRGNFIKNWACENLTFVPWNTDDAYSEYPEKETAKPGPVAGVFAKWLSSGSDTIDRSDLDIISKGKIGVDKVSDADRAFVKASVKDELKWTQLDKHLDQGKSSVSMLKLVSFSCLLFSFLLAVAWKFNLLSKKRDHSKFAV